MPRIDLNGTSIHYEVLGAGEPVVFLNGVMMTVRSWGLQSAFFKRRFRCVLHDMRGQLLSAKPDEPWTLADHADDLLALLDHLGIDRCHLVGTSYGGEVGMIFAIEHPARVKSLSIVSSVSEVGPDLDRAVASWAETALENPAGLYRSAIPFNFSQQFIAASSYVLEQGEKRLAKCAPEFFTAFAQLVEAFRGLDITERLASIRCPTLVMVGSEDRLKPPRYSRLIADRIPAAEYLEVAGAGHAVVLERPSEVNSALLGFIEKKHLKNVRLMPPPTPAMGAGSG